MYAVIKNFMNGDKKVVYKTAEIEAWHPLPMPPEEEQ